eukprot:Amastigsp_a840989_40230.p1 type:complete len:204 gc:universal Amastigsp_a840989_40230:630-19(-)
MSRDVEADDADGDRQRENTLQERAAALLLLLGRRVCCVDLLDDVVEDVVDVVAGLGRALHERARPLLGLRVALLLLDNAVVLEIALVAHKHKRHSLGVLDAENLLVDVVEVVERRHRSDRVHENEPLAVLHVKVAHRGELLSAGSVENLEEALLPVDLRLLAVRVLDRGVVLVDEDALDELHSQRRLADTARAEHNELVFTHV